MPIRARHRTRRSLVRVIPDVCQHSLLRMTNKKCLTSGDSGTVLFHEGVFGLEIVLECIQTPERFLV